MKDKKQIKDFCHLFRMIDHLFFSFSLHFAFCLQNYSSIRLQLDVLNYIDVKHWTQSQICFWTLSDFLNFSLLTFEFAIVITSTMKISKNNEFSCMTLTDRVIKKITHSRQTEFVEIIFFTIDLDESLEHIDILDIFRNVFFDENTFNDVNAVSIEIAIKNAKTAELEKTILANNKKLIIKKKWNKRLENADVALYRRLSVTFKKTVFFDRNDAKTFIDYFDDSKFALLFIDFLQITFKMMKNIDRQRFNIRDILKLTINDAMNFNETSESRNVRQLIKFFEIFDQILYALASVSFQQFLQRTMSIYRMRLLNKIDISTFDFVEEFHMKFVIRAMFIELIKSCVWRYRWDDIWDDQIFQKTRSDACKNRSLLDNVCTRFRHLIMICAELNVTNEKHTIDSANVPNKTR